VITGRCVDSAVTLGVLMHEFGWAHDDLPRIAQGTAAGHLLECTASVTGGCFGWPGKKDVPDLARNGFPFADVKADGSIVIGKTPGSGGRLDVMTCTEQLIYEIHDPTAYITPDCVLDITGIALTLKIVLGVWLAMLLARNLKFKRIIRGVVLLPFVIPTALSTLAWLWMFDSLYSVVNWTAISLHLISAPGPNWLGQSAYAMAAVITVNVWRGLPFFAITVLAGLVAVPREYLEAAEVDGASSWGRFWHVTLPLIKPVLAVFILFSTIFTFADFNIVQVLTRGGPVNTTHLFATLAYQVGLQGGNLGQGAAISLFIFPLLALVVFFQLRYVRNE